MIDGIMRKLGYINEKKLIDVAIAVYERNESSEAKTNDSFYYCCGNANAIGYILARFGIDFHKIIKVRRMKNDKQRKTGSDEQR